MGGLYCQRNLITPSSIIHWCIHTCCSRAATFSTRSPEGERKGKARGKFGRKEGLCEKREKTDYQSNDSRSGKEHLLAELENG